MSGQFFQEVLAEAQRRQLLSDEHFTVDGTLLESWASLKSFRPKDARGPKGGGRNPEVDFRGEERKNESHASTTDPEARLARKGPGKEAKLCFAGHVLMNRNGLAVGCWSLRLLVGRSGRLGWTCFPVCGEWAV